MSLAKKVILNTGQKIPLLGFGTWQSAPGQVGEAVLEALKTGYRHLDLATIYENQHEVATGIKRAFQEIPNLKREDIFITSKLWNSQHHPDVVESSLDACLEELGLEYLDLYLVHFPVAFQRGHSLNPVDEETGDMILDNSISIVDTWRAMTQLPKSKVRSVGVSNHTIEHLEAIIKGTGVVPAVNQIERHPVLQSNDLVEYAKAKGIHLTAYSAFGNNMFRIPLLIFRTEVEEVAASVSKRLGRKVSGAQVILAWSQVGGHSVIPKSVTPARIRQNFDEVELTLEEVQKVSSLGENRRRYNIPFVANKPRWDVNIFGEPEEQVATHSVVL